MATLAPAWAHDLEMARPMPRLPPVVTIVPLSLISNTIVKGDVGVERQARYGVMCQYNTRLCERSALALAPEA